MKVCYNTSVNNERGIAMYDLNTIIHTMRAELDAICAEAAEGGLC